MFLRQAFHLPFHNYAQNINRPMVSEKELTQQGLTKKLRQAMVDLNDAVDKTILSNYPLYRAFFGLLKQAHDTPELFPIKEQELLIELTQCTTLKIKDADNKENNEKYERLMEEVGRVSADKANACRSPRAHFLRKVGICILGIVAVAGLVLGTLALTATLGHIDPALGLLGLAFGIGLIGLVATQFRNSYRTFEKNHKNQSAYVEVSAYLKVNKERANEPKPSFFFASVPKSNSSSVVAKENQGQEQQGGQRSRSRSTPSK